MSDPIRIAAAPVSWGVFEPDTAVSPEQVLTDITTTGYDGTELGPLGFFGTAEVVRQALQERQLALVAAFLPLPFSDADSKRQNVRTTTELLDYLERATPTAELPSVLLSDAYADAQRIAVAGRVADHPETWLDEIGWSTLINQVGDIAKLCHERGFQVAFHPHGGSFIETAEETAKLLDNTDRDTLALCIDTGHCFFGGGDPLELLREHKDAVHLVHLKDVDLNVLRRLKKNGFGLDEAWRQGVFCELGNGGVDLDAFLSELRAQRFAGWLVVEQDRILTADVQIDVLRQSAEVNRAFLRKRSL